MGERLRSQHPPTDPPGVLRARAAAKINLALLVGARRDDGFHEVVSVMQAVGLWDDLEVAVAAHGFGLEVDGEGLPPDESNLVLVAARELARRSLDLPGVRFRLRKGIPISAGLGGGSADGAAALLALDRLWQLHLPSVNLRVMATEIGSDVPFCLSGGSQVGTGRGERLGAAPVKGTLWWVVAIDSDGLGTAPVYQHYDELGLARPLEDRWPSALLEALAAGDLERIGASLTNDLEPAAFDLHPALEAGKDKLLEAGAVGAVMSGSGPPLTARPGTIRAREQTPDGGWCNGSTAAFGAVRSRFESLPASSGLERRPEAGDRNRRPEAGDRNMGGRRPMALSVVVLAAGEGKRFRSALPKPLHRAAGRPLLWHVLAATAGLGAERTVVVVGRGADEVRTAVDSFGFGQVDFAVQPELRGTGDAVAAALPLLPTAGEVLVLYGDTPLLTAGTLERLLAAHRRGGAQATVLTARLPDPTGLGRVLRGPGGAVTGVVEQRDATAEQRAITEVNAGFYVFERRALAGLARLQPDNDQGEYYLPALIPLLLEAGGPGVTVVDPATTYVDTDVEVGQDTVLEPLTFLEAGTRVGAGCSIGPNTRLIACTVGDEATVTQAVAVQSHVGARAVVGPFAYLRPGVELGPGSKVGTYVEVKKSSIGRGSKVPHLTYVGDAEIGEDVNVGAGTVFVNYDGRDKHRTVVGDGSFIGSDTMLVAPLTIGEGAQTAAGSTITKDVPPGALAIERAVQRTVEGWAARRRRRQATPHHTSDHEQTGGSGSEGGGQ